MNVIFIGRFQPIHFGHMEVIKEFLPRSQTFTLVIGSAQESHTLRNPFTAGERFGMIKKALADENLTKVDIIPIVDINRYNVWVSHVESFVPPFDTVISNNPLTRRLFSERGYEVVEPKLYDRSRYSGEEIRRRIIENESWQDLVPKSVVRIIESIEGTERVRACATRKVGERNE